MAANQIEKVILLVDDDEDEHEIFHSALKSIGRDFTFLSAVICEHALKISINIKVRSWLPGQQECV